jgi:hypothetical protein
MTSKPATSRAAALVTPGQPLQLIDVPIPDPIEDGAILVRTQVARKRSAEPLLGAVRKMVLRLRFNEQ